MGQTSCMAAQDDDWNREEREPLPWPISESDDDAGPRSPWGGILAVLVAFAAALAIIWGTIDYFVG